VFGSILAIAVTLMQGYVFWRAYSVPFVKKHLPRNLLVGAGLTLWSIFIFGSAVSADLMGALAVPLELWNMTWLAMLFLTSIALMAVDMATGFGTWMKRVVPQMRALGLVAGGALSAMALVQGLRAPVINNYEVLIASLPAELDGTVVVGLTDLHLGALLGKRWLEDRVRQVQAEHPDVVVFIGDVFEGHSTPDKGLLAELRSFSAPLGTWGVLGNHEFHAVRNDNATFFEEAGVHLLRNSWVELRPGLVMAGVDDAQTGNDGSVAGTTLKAALAGRPPGALLLLSHVPLPTDVVTDAGIDLMLAGHTHGGQIWPFGYLVRKRYPLFEGRYDLTSSTAIVSRGAGTWGPRMRLWKPAEIIRVTLRSDAPATKQLSVKNTFGPDSNEPYNNLASPHTP
jgi:predicted MPP superfamily phosphohydrolase